MSVKLLLLCLYPRPLDQTHMGQFQQDGNLGLIVALFFRLKQYHCFHNLGSNKVGYVGSIIPQIQFMKIFRRFYELLCKA